jgi:hypothetical protein
MKIRIKNLYQLPFLFLFFFAIFPAIFFAPGVMYSLDSTLIPFTLKDQFERVYNREDFLGKILLVVGSDKEGSSFNRLWGKAIHDSLKKYQLNQEVQFLPVADVRGVPFFLKGFVRGKFPREKKSWVLLDWKGLFAKAYEFIPGATNILLIRRDGKVAYQVHGHEPENEKTSRLLEVLFQLPGVKKVPATGE